MIDQIKKALEEQMAAYRADLDAVSKMLKDNPPAQVKADLESLVAKQERRVNELEAQRQTLPADSTKKSTIKRWPNGMLAKTAGMMMNSSEGPAVGSKPKANTAGKMAIPASMETNRSAHITRNAVTGIF